MKRKNILSICLLAATSLASCVSEEISTTKSGEGVMTLDVELLKPQATRADVNTSEFPVVIYNAEGTAVKSFSQLADVPKQVPLEVGNYTVESHTPGMMEKIMTTPYYKGTEDVTILKGINSKADVVCKMANGSFTINYSSAFITDFSSWDITIDDGGESALHFSNTDGNDPAIIYMAFEENVSKLTVNFKGKTTAGNTISASNTLTKVAASEKYDDDNTNFSGGDAIVINFEPVASSEGNITGVTLTADIRFEEHEEWISMEVGDKENGFVPDTPDPGPGEPGGGEITMNLPAPISFPILGADDVSPSLGDTYLAATAGFRSITVSISSTSADMNNSLAELSTQYGVDFISGAEIVDNQNVVALFDSLGQPLSVPSQGDTSYNFPIGNFFGFLQVLAGSHTFYLTVTDMQGNTKSGSVNITITQ